MSVKKCSGCKQEFPIDNFYKNRNMSDGHSSYCVDCTKENSKRYFQRKKEKFTKTYDDTLLKVAIMSNYNSVENQNAENLMKILMIEKMIKSISEELQILKNNFVKSETLSI